MVQHPIVSVIITTYNRGYLIDKAINSVLNQTYQDYEIIIVDDGSTDNTKEVVKGFIDSRINYIFYADNLGVSAARNTGIKASQGEYIALLDSDDEWLPEKLEKQVVILQNESFEVGVVCSWQFNINANGEYICRRHLPKKGGNIYEDLLYTNPISAPTLLIRKECFEKVGLFDDLLNGQEDWDMWIRISKYYEFALIKIPLLKYRLHPNQISKNLEAKIITAKRILVKYSNELQSRPYANSKHHFSIGNRLCHMGKTKEGRYYQHNFFHNHKFPFNCLLFYYIN